MELSQFGTVFHVLGLIG